MPDCSNDVRDLAARVGRVEQDVDRIKTAFLRNDLDAEDYDGHRNDHRVRVEQAKTMDDYKQAATKRIIVGAVALAFTIFSFGIESFLRAKIASWVGLLGGG